MKTGRHNSITDVPGVEVGHFTDDEALTGTTVILCRDGAIAGVDVRGAAPGTRETDLLEPENLVQKVQAVVLSGGSAYGLDSASGVMRFLEERGYGQPVGGGRVVPIVPAAVIYDLEVGDGGQRPSAESGYLAARNATSHESEAGNVGAGTGARAGGLKGGVGSASVVLASGIVIGAIAVVNSLGRPFDAASGELYGRALELEGEFEDLAPSTGPIGGPDDYGDLFPTGASLAGRNTTIGVVATTARLDKAGARKLAQTAHDGLARAIRPAHTLFDGDTIFGLSTGSDELAGPAETARLGAVAADVFTRAVVHAMLEAKSAGGLQSHRDAYPRLYRQGER